MIYDQTRLNVNFSKNLTNKPKMKKNKNKNKHEDERVCAR